MPSDQFSLHITGHIQPNDGKFPILASEYALIRTTIPDVNLKRKFHPRMRPFRLPATLPIIQYMYKMFDEGADLETACWNADFITHRDALSAMVADSFKLAVEVFQGRIFIRLLDKGYLGIPPKTEEQRNMSAFTVAFLTNSEGHPEWRHYKLRKMMFGKHKVYFNALIDAKKSNGELVEIRSRKGYNMSQKSGEVLWLENHLSGIETTFVGYNEENGKMTKIEQYRNNKEIIKKCHLKQSELDAYMKKIEDVLDLITQFDDESYYPKFFVVKESDKTGCRLVENNDYDLISDEFKQKFAD